MRVERPVGPPGPEPITPEQAAHYRRVDDLLAEDRNVFELAIRAAREYAERRTGRALVDRDWELVLDRFPCGRQPIEITRVPVNIASIEIRYVDADGAEQTLDPSAYVVVDGEPVRIAPIDEWPATPCDRIGVVVVKFQVGPGAVGVPDILRSAMLLHVGDLYEHREDTIAGGTVTPRRVVDMIYDEYAVGRRYA